MQSNVLLYAPPHQDLSWRFVSRTQAYEEVIHNPHEEGALGH